MKKKLLTLAVAATMVAVTVRAQRAPKTFSITSNAAALETHLRDSATVFGDSVIVIGTFDMTGRDSIPINKGVVLRGTFDLIEQPLGTLIYSNSNYLNIEGNNAYPDVFLFLMDSASTVCNLRLRGHRWAYAGYEHYPMEDTTGNNIYSPCGYPAEGNSNCIYTKKDNCTIKNCELFGWTKHPVLAKYLNNFLMKDTWVHHCKGEGWGYGIWTGAPANTTDPNCNPATLYRNFTTDWGNAYIKRCIFNENRHDMDGQFNRYSVYVDGCSFSAISMRGNVMRHASTWKAPNGLIVGGSTTSITNSRFYKIGALVLLQYPNINCFDSAKFILQDNKFKYSNLCTKNGDGSYRVQLDSMCINYFTGDYHVVNTGNESASSFSNTPRGSFSVYNGATYLASPVVTAGTTITAVCDSCKNSADVMADTTSMKLWRFNDTPDFMNSETRSKAVSVQHTYNDPGIYVITTTMVDTNYLASDFMKKQILVKPASGIKLVVNIKDSHIATVTTGVQKYIQFNDSIVWTDDIEGDEGWQRVEVDVSGLVHTTNVYDSVTVGFRVISDADPMVVRGCKIYIDDAYLNDANGLNVIRNGTFEGDVVTPWTQKTGVINANATETAKPYNIGQLTDGTDMKSGTIAYQMNLPFLGLAKKFWLDNSGTCTSGRKYNTGTYGYIRQKFKYYLGGVYRTSEIINEQKPVTTINMFPNPANTTLTLSGDFKNARIKLYDMKGVLVLSESNLQNGNSINVADLTNGVYFTVITDESSGDQLKRKLVIAR